ncbi:MAG: hypothetical protein H6R41_550 [Deltaproteobacteria bacterium]|nr:hypothetical protein [Deltaproteobacteria bacterium]
MKRTRTGIPVLLACAVIAMTLQPVSAPAATCEKWAGKVVSAQGVVEVKAAGQTQWLAVKLNETYCPGDTIRTDRKSRADIALYNHPVLRLDQNSTVTLGGMRDERTSLVDMVSGAALFFSRVTRNLEVRTATVNAGVEGTEFFLRVEEGKTDLTVFEGKVLAANAAGTLPVTTGQSAVAEAGKAPAYRTVVRPRDAVQWALYYPPIVDPRPAGLKEDSGDPRFYTTRASQLLAVGRVDEANADIAKALAMDPKNSDAFALQSIVAVTQNEKGKALDLAQRAVASDPKSATARIALSYAQQAHFDLPGALASLDDAVKLAPENALAWARLAELQQSFGHLDKSLGAAKKAAGLNPDLSRTQTVLGFSHLTRIETKEAQGVFEKAIKLDDTDPLPRLGLGLAKIRDGNLEEGRREIEIAMSLDPNNSLIRSYLGKAYYEEKRDKLATGQFDMAKSLDPSDPTPYFYDAIEKQTTNRPAEALQDMENAIARNDNRAIYRSRLLLDQDLAARSASLARIYGDLGFQELALVEGWKSVNTDPGNYSAHRFLADSYAALPRHEIARVSELLQSQLLQPINISPVPPSLAESNLLVVSGGGPSNPSFNEYNPLFERNRGALLLNGVLGQQNTAGGEAVASMLANNVSASVGYYGYQTEGFRPNSDLKDTIFNFFTQVSLSPKASIQAEYRNRDRTNGDLKMTFFPDDFSPNLTEEARTETFRLGFHYAFSPGSHLLASAVYQRDSLESLDHPVDPFLLRIESNSERTGRSGELQHLYSSDRFKTVAGAGYFRVTGDDALAVDFLLDPGPPPLTDTFAMTAPQDSRHVNVYLYTYFGYGKTVTFTIGASGDFFTKDFQDLNLNTVDYTKNQFNPKLGVVWNPVPDTTVRGAIFRTLRRTLTTNATLEPTQVAGFNQFYDESGIAAVTAWNYGLALDQKFKKNVYGGVEGYYRDLDVPFPTIDLNTNTLISTVENWKEKVGRAYLYWNPHNWVALNAEYLYERFERGETGNLQAKEVTTQRVPLGINFFHPSGLNAMVKGSYWDQTGSITRKVDFPPVYQSVGDNFWLVDAAIGYRLPQRYGFLTVGAKNLFNQSFNYYDTDPVNPAIQPVRTFYGKINLSL